MTSNHLRFVTASQCRPYRLCGPETECSWSSLSHPLISPTDGRTAVDREDARVKTGSTRTTAYRPKSNLLGHRSTWQEVEPTDKLRSPLCTIIYGD